MSPTIDLADDVRSDADLVVTWAIEAIDSDRLDLAAHLIRLARHLRHGPTAAPLIAPAVAVPLVGATRNETPNPAYVLSADGYRCCAQVDGGRLRCMRPIRLVDGSWVHNDPEVLDHDAYIGPVG